MLTPYYEEENITIYHGDCLEVMPQLTQKFDCIIADLPYQITGMEWDRIINPQKMWEQYSQVSENKTPIILFSSQPFTSKLILSNEGMYKYSWYWYKNMPSNFTTVEYQPMRVIEEICVFYKNQPIYNKQPALSRIKDRKRVVGAKNGTSAKTRRGENHWYKNVKGIANVFREYISPNNVLEIDCVPRATGTLNPTQKPLPLLQYLIKTYTNEGDIILDNTMGSGTTLVAAKKEGRKAVGIELREDQCKIAIQRLKEVNPFYQKPSKKKDTPYEGFDMEDWLKS